MKRIRIFWQILSSNWKFNSISTKGKIFLLLQEEGICITMDPKHHQPSTSLLLFEQNCKIVWPRTEKSTHLIELDNRWSGVTSLDTLKIPLVTSSKWSLLLLWKESHHDKIRKCIVLQNPHNSGIYLFWEGKLSWFLFSHFSFLCLWQRP